VDEDLAGVWTVYDDAGRAVQSGPILASGDDHVAARFLPDVDGNAPILKRGWSLALDWPGGHGRLTPEP
jgi:hypothetical protein